MAYYHVTHLKLKSLEASFAHDLFRSCEIDLTIFAAYGSDTVVFYAKLQNDCTIDTRVMDDGDFARFELIFSKAPLHPCPHLLLANFLSDSLALFVINKRIF